MALLPVTLGRAGPLSSEVLDLQVTEHGPAARVIGRHLRLVCHSGITNRALEVTSLREHPSFVDTASATLQSSL